MFTNSYQLVLIPPHIKLWYNTPKNERTISIFDRFMDLVHNSGAVHVYGLDPENPFPTNTAFRGGRALFYTTYMQDIVRHRDMVAEIGVLPLPKYDEFTPKHFAPVDAGQNIFIVPITAGNPERTSIIMEAFAAEGHRSVIPAFFEISLQTQHARDDESQEMLEIIRAGMVYDFGYFNHHISGFQLAFAGHHLVNDRALSLTTLFERYHQAALDRIDEFNNEEQG